MRRPPDNRDVRDDLAPDTELRIFQSIADPVDIELGSGPGMGRWYWWRSPRKTSDCQSVERTSVSKILLRETLALAMMQRSRPDAAGDMAMRFIERSPDRRGRAQRSSAAGPARS